MKTWGPLHVANAREVYEILIRRPTQTDHQAWLELLAIPPPVWGDFGRCRRVRRFKNRTRGIRVWTWDNHSLVFSDDLVLQPPAGVRYLSWHALLEAAA